MQLKQITVFFALVALLVFFGAKCNNATHHHHLVLGKPAVLSTDPVNHATAVPVNQVIHATFNDSMDPLTLTTSTFTLTDGGTTVAGTVSLSGNIATFMPNSDLLPDTVYTARITTGTADTEGHHMMTDFVWTFTTAGGGVDHTPPTVDSVFPLNAATNVPINTQVSVTFSEAMDPASLDSTTFVMKHSGTPVTGLVNTTGADAVFRPTGNLDMNTTYDVTITTGARDLAGNALESDYTWTFTTGSSSDTTAPAVTSVQPSDTSTGIARNTQLHAIFTESVNPQTITTLSFQLHQGATLISGTVAAQGNEAFFTPDANLAADTVYSARLTTTITDMAGNALAHNEEWSFTTGATTTPISTVSLGHASGYAILAGSGVNVVATSSIDGDVGLSPSGEIFITGLALTDATGYATSTQVTGLVYAADMDDPTPANLVLAHSDLSQAFQDAKNRMPVPTGINFNPGSGDLAGLTLLPGLYKFSGSAQATAAFTLNGSASDIWIFQIPGALEVSNSVHVFLTGGAQAKNIFWQVGTSATMGNDVIFNGTLMVNDTITLNHNVLLTGRALSRSGSVVLNQGTIAKPAP